MFMSKPKSSKLAQGKQEMWSWCDLACRSYLLAFSLVHLEPVQGGSQKKKPTHLWWLIFDLNSDGLGIARKTYLWVHLWGCFQKCLAEKGEAHPIPNSDSTVLWAGAPDWMKRELRTLFHLCLLPDRSLPPQLPNIMNHGPWNCKPSYTLSSLNSFCRYFVTTMGKAAKQTHTCVLLCFEPVEQNSMSFVERLVWKPQ